jgi:hypothetical protein
MEKNEIDLDNPIFVYYINVSNWSHEHIAEYSARIQEAFSYDNVTTWVVPRYEGETKIECIYDGKIKDRTDELNFLIEEINEKVYLLSESISFEDLKINIRNWRIEKLID